MKTLTDHVPNALLMAMVSVVLLSGCDYPVDKSQAQDPIGLYVPQGPPIITSEL